MEKIKKDESVYKHIINNKNKDIIDPPDFSEECI